MALEPIPVSAFPEQVTEPLNTAIFPLVQEEETRKIQFENMIKGLRAQSATVITMFLDVVQKNQNEHWNGSLDVELTGQVLNSGSPIGPVPQGIGNVMIVVNAGTDIIGTITVTGDTVDKDTGVVTIGDTEDLALTQLAVDNTSTDAEGNTIYDIENALMTQKWFKGAFTLSTADVTLTDVDIYHCTYTRNNETPGISVETYNLTALATNDNAWLYSYLYTVRDTPPLVTIKAAVALTVTAAESVADEYYRLRRGNLGIDLDSTTDGFFVMHHFGPDNQARWEDVSASIWIIFNTPIVNNP